MEYYDLCLAWNWKHDSDFVRLFSGACHSRGLSLLQITPENLPEILLSLAEYGLNFQSFFDRATDADKSFIPVVEWARANEIYCVNPHERASRGSNKAEMHLRLIGAGLYTPYTIILPPYLEQPEPAPVDLSPLGKRFTIKPAHGGGGEGVITEATSMKQVLEARKAYPDDRYLLQAHIVPVNLEGRPAWFRVLYCAGRIFPCWWDTGTHIYTPLGEGEEDRFGLGRLRQMTATIAGLCHLDLFTTEIALTADHLFIVIDYVNDQIDLRLQSKALEGVPDYIVGDVAAGLVELMARSCPSLPGV